MSRCHHIPSFNSFSGNTRVSFDQTGKVLQDNSYYPFGMGLGEALTHIQNTFSENKYLYNGNPDRDRGQDDFGLGWYEFGARMYDPSIGRWNGIYARAENYFSLSTYNYGLNNPLLLIDLDCMDPKGYDIEEIVAGRYGGGVYGSISGIDEYGNISLGEKSNSDDNKNSQEKTKKADPVTTRLTAVALGKGAKSTFGSKVIAASYSRGESEASSGVATNGGGANSEGGNAGVAIQTTSDINNGLGIIITATGEVLQSTRFSANFTYLISGNTGIINTINNTIEYAPYVGLLVTTATGSYLSSQDDPATGRPYQTWAETGSDIGANVMTIVIGAKYGGWVGAGAATFYLLDKAAFKWYLNTIRSNPNYVLPSSTHSFTH